MCWIRHKRKRMHLHIDGEGDTVYVELIDGLGAYMNAVGFAYGDVAVTAVEMTMVMAATMESTKRSKSFRHL
jgi:hypothetical protein